MSCDLCRWSDVVYGYIEETDESSLSRVCNCSEDARHNVLVNDKDTCEFDSTRKIYLVPSLRERENLYMYCNWVRMNPYEERCLTCDRDDCRHKGKHTILEV